MISRPEELASCVREMTERAADERTQREVMAELRWDDRLCQAILGVVVENRVVSLTGSVPSLGTLLAAEDAVRRVPGVDRVENNIVVVAPRGHQSDPEIARRVERTIEWESESPAGSPVTATARGGRVTLRGVVGSIEAREQAARAAGHVLGVRGVVNQIRVLNGETPSDAAVLDRISASLDRQALRESMRLSVRVRGGKVRLAGVVRTWPERTAVLEAAERTPGVHEVDASRLRVDPLAFTPAVGRAVASHSEPVVGPHVALALG